MSSALSYNESRNYSSAQIEMIQGVVGATADGRWGPSTVDAVERWQKDQGLSADGKVGPQTLVAMFVQARTADPGLWPVVNVGAWSGQSSLNNPNDDVAFCAAHGINRLYVVVNDHSTSRSARDFDTFTRSKIVTLSKVARDAGVEVHLMSWIMPHATYLRQAAEQLIPLVADTGARSLQWDAEEPWTQAVDPPSYEEAAQQVARELASLTVPMGVTGIGYTPADKFGPLAAVCKTLVPQCYATSGGSLKPESAVSSCVDRWRSKGFGGASPAWEIGLAAYRQEGIEGHTVASAMTASLDNARAYQFDSVVYWSLRQIRGSAEVTQVIGSIRNQG
ncbi:MAG: peptidoglycan-binding protein [Myxococcales bacterium]|nr:peptidoglycan-binding protein [Myxococcales bacterium]